MFFNCCRGGGELLRQLHELAEAESELSLHQRRLAEIDDKVSFVPKCSTMSCNGFLFCSLFFFLLFRNLFDSSHTGGFFFWAETSLGSQLALGILLVRGKKITEDCGEWKPCPITHTWNTTSNEMKNQYGELLQIQCNSKLSNDKIELHEEKEPFEELV